MNKDFLKEIGIYSEDPNVVLDKLGAKEIELLDKKDLAETNGAHDRVKEINALLKKLKAEREVARKEAKSYVPKKADPIQKKDTKAEQKNQKAKEDAAYNKLIKDKADAAANPSPVQTPKPTPQPAQGSQSSTATTTTGKSSQSTTTTTGKSSQSTTTTAGKSSQSTTTTAGKSSQSTTTTTGKTSQPSTYRYPYNSTNTTNATSTSYGSYGRSRTKKFFIGMLISIIGLVYVLKGFNPVFCEETVPQINNIFFDIPEFLIFKTDFILELADVYVTQQGIFGGWLVLIGYIIRGLGASSVKTLKFRGWNGILLMLSRGSVIAFYVVHIIANLIESGNLAGNGGIIRLLSVIVCILLGKIIGWIAYKIIG